MVNDATDKLTRHQVDHLILLVGGNPLPNAVAGSLLSKPTSIISLIYTQGTVDIADRFRQWFASSLNGRTIRQEQVEESHAGTVNQKVEKVIKEVAGESVGLNFTGGTKVMGVHSYLTLQRLRDDFRNRALEFSYLDPRSLSLLFDPQDPSSGGDSERIPVGTALEISLKDMLTLHGWKLFGDIVDWPILPASAAELGRIQADHGKANRWREWLENELFNNARRKIPKTGTCSAVPDHGVCTVQVPGERWLSNRQLKDMTLALPDQPDLADFARILSQELEGCTAINIGDAAEVCGYNAGHRDHFCDWLNGTWLESFVLGHLQALGAEGFPFHDICMNVEPGPPGAKEHQFEFDVVAIHGYQLFAFSCTTITESEPRGKALLKSKLMESVQRGRQMGGDEACIALVCCSDHPTVLEQEVRSSFSSDTPSDGDGNSARSQGRIKVFGREHLGHLKGYLRDWIRDQTG
jgi:hypothetical protein